MSDQSVTLKVENIFKKFDDFVAVDNLSFDVRAGRVFGFLGPNGAGKTTTIRMIVGITIPDQGRVRLFGERISPALQDRIGYLPEERGLYKKMKVADQLRYFAALKGMSARDADRGIDAWLERMNLSEWKTRKTSDLSKGMSQKIQFVSAVLHDPDLLILDEPFSGLDPVNVEFLIEVVAELKSKQKTIIFSTHLMETAERLCDDIILINKSRRVLGGTLREVKEGFGRNRIALRAVGGDEVLANRAIVEAVRTHADEREIELAEGADLQDLLRRLIESGAKITKFEQIEPRLNDIFIEQVGGADA